MSGYEGDKLDRLTEEGWTDTQRDTDAKKEMRRWKDKPKTKYRCHLVATFFKAELITVSPLHTNEPHSVSMFISAVGPQVHQLAWVSTNTIGYTVKVFVPQVCPLGDPMDCSPPGSSVQGILQAGILESFLSPGDLPDPKIEPGYPALQRDSLQFEPSGKACPVIGL